MGPELYGISVIPLIVAMVEAFKKSGLPSHWSPIISMVLGVLAGVALRYEAVSGGTLNGPNIVQGIVIGVSLGLGAVGLYATVSSFNATSNGKSLEALVSTVIAPPEKPVAPTSSTIPHPAPNPLQST